MTLFTAAPSPADISAQPDWIRYAMAVALMLGFAFTSVLSGCANTATGASGNNDASTRQEIVTESDEPETRKRARIRLELASGYFAEGKTTVALDEIKQALVNDPGFGDAYNLRGLIYMRLNDPRLAEESFKRALSINARDANAAHNVGWLMCQQKRYPESLAFFGQALAVPLYTDQAKTLMTQGICQIAANQKPEAERSLARSYELDAANPITGYNLASLLYERADYTRAQFYIRRLNNTDFANSETLWLGIKVERRLDSDVAMQQLVGQLKRRFPQSRELAAYERGAFNE
jgi:type IV pilus assembly protein PilF